MVEESKDQSYLKTVVLHRPHFDSIELTCIEANSNFPCDILLDSKIKITSKFYQIANGERKFHEGKILFGRQGDIRFHKDDDSISRNHFRIEFYNDLPYFVCTSPYPKPLTSFKISEIPFYLRENHIISFAKRNTIFVEELSTTQPFIKFKKIEFYKRLKADDILEFKIETKNEKDLGTIDESLAHFKIIIGFDDLRKKWYISGLERSHEKFKDPNFETLVYLFDYREKIEKKQESSRNLIEKNLILKVGDYSLVVENSIN